MLWYQDIMIVKNSLKPHLYTIFHIFSFSLCNVLHRYQFPFLRIPTPKTKRPPQGGLSIAQGPGHRILIGQCALLGICRCGLHELPENLHKVRLKRSIGVLAQFKAMAPWFRLIAQKLLNRLNTAHSPFQGVPNIFQTPWQVLRLYDRVLFPYRLCKLFGFPLFDFFVKFVKIVHKSPP